MLDAVPKCDDTKLLAALEDAKKVHRPIAWLGLSFAIFVEILFFAVRFKEGKNISDTWSTALYLVNAYLFTILFMPGLEASTMLRILRNARNEHCKALAIVADNRPFALFLRNSSSECRTETGGVGTGFNFTNYAQREGELFREISRWIPVIGLANWEDQTEGHLALRLWVDPPRWFEAVQELAVRAAVIVIDYEQEAPGINKELDLVGAHSIYTSKTILLSTTEGMVELKKNRSACISTIKWTIVNTRFERHFGIAPRWTQVTYPADFLAHVRRLKREYSAKRPTFDQ